MSAKWVRSKQWDDRHIPAALWPVKVALRMLSSIPLAVMLMVCVAVYAVLASVPIGLLALGPTYLLYGLTLLGLVGLVSGVPAWLLGRGLAKAPRATSFLAVFCVGIGLAGLAVWLWAAAVWPAIRFDPAGGTGIRLFAGFVDANKSITLRRLPMLEMSEIEFYAWWPLRVILVLFIVNLIVATVRRIEFSFPYVGVLTVHTGIILIALGSIYYSADKVEGDILLMAGAAGRDGLPTPGPAQGQFFDHLQTALHFQLDGMWFSRPIEGLPRYNDYGLAVGGGATALQAVGAAPAADDGGRALDLPVRVTGAAAMGPGADLRFRVVGYAAYAEPMDDWVQADPAGPLRPGMGLNPVRFYELLSALPEEGAPATEGPGRTVARLFSLPADPRARTADNGVFAVEYTIGMPEQRWADLSVALPPGTEHGLIVEAGGERGVFAVEEGEEVTVGGYRVRVDRLSPRPPFPIITEGYRDAESSVAIVHVTPPEGGAFDRWVYHRFPEISQDLLEETNERGMPRRRDADPAIRIAFIDAGQLQVYINEAAGGSARAIVRQRGGSARTFEGLSTGDAIEIVSKISVRLGERWTHSEAVQRPAVVPEASREKDFIGTHDQAMVGVELSVLGPDGVPRWNTTVWLPFTKFLGTEPDKQRQIGLPDGRRLTLAFGRRLHNLPGFTLSLRDFEMLAYDHRGAPRDYQSRVRVECTDGSFESFEHITKLNSPLRAPFMWSDERPWIANAVGRIVSGLSPRQFKFSQAGWDAQGWKQTQALADQGVLPRPFASFTILGVGNNPGIHIIAAGGLLMSIGIPWAFYVKPAIMRSRKRRIQQQVAEGTYRKPERVREGVKA